MMLVSSIVGYVDSLDTFQRASSLSILRIHLRSATAHRHFLFSTILYLLHTNLSHCSALSAHAHASQFLKNQPLESAPRSNTHSTFKPDLFRLDYDGRTVSSSHLGGGSSAMIGGRCPVCLSGLSGILTSRSVSPCRQTICSGVTLMTEKSCASITGPS